MKSGKSISPSLLIVMIIICFYGCGGDHDDSAENEERSISGEIYAFLIKNGHELSNFSFKSTISSVEA